MFIQTTRFGSIEVDEGRLIDFPRGLLGFTRHRRYALLQPSEDGPFLWLQSIEAPELAFVVTDPALFVPGYQLPARCEQLEDLGADTSRVQVFVIVNKRGSVLTGNLQGPLVVQTDRRIGVQMVLADRRYTTRVPLLELNPEQAATA